MAICNCHQPTKTYKHTPELADIFRDHINELDNLSPEQWKAVNAIISCRTAKLGAHVLECNNCGEIEQSYNSCRNRHCPKCQTLARLKWLDERTEELLDTQYFHVVFTIPDYYNPIILQNKKIIYNILFKAVKETLLETAENPENLGAKIGFIAILHTWGQQLLDHPHIHCVVTGGGISENHKKWISCKKDYFIRVEKLSRLFRGKMLDYLKRAFNRNELTFHGRIQRYKNTNEFQLLIDKGWNTEWVVYSKETFSTPENVFKYLGRYINRIALSNNRIMKLENGKVTLSWKDYKDDNAMKYLKLNVKEFMRRFLLHVLPDRFVRIRFYGLLASRNKKELLDKCRKLITKQTGKKAKSRKQCKNAVEYLKDIMGIDLFLCKKCGEGKILVVEIIQPEKTDLYNDSS